MTDPVDPSVLFASWPDFSPSSSDPAPGPSSCDRSPISTDTPGLVPLTKINMDHDRAEGEEEDDDLLSGSDDESLGGMDLDADNGDVRFSTVWALLWFLSGKSDELT